MKKLIFILLIIFAKGASAQSYQYYFIEIRATGKGDVEVQPELGVNYPDIDTLLVASRETKKNGAVIVTGKKYGSYSEVFNKLSATGLEFVQFSNLPTFGGATGAMLSDLRSNYAIWRRVRNQP